MVYAPRRPTAGHSLREKRAALPGYQAALDTLPTHHADAIRRYVASIHAEAAAQRREATQARTENVRLRAALPAHAGHPDNEGAQP